MVRGEWCATWPVAAITGADGLETQFAPASTPPERPFVAAHDPLYDIESQSGAFAHRLGGEEWIEDATLHFGRNTGAVVADLDEDPVGLNAGPYQQHFGLTGGRFSIASKALSMRLVQT